jgi:hypothetical protein
VHDKELASVKLPGRIQFKLKTNEQGRFLSMMARPISVLLLGNIISVVGIQTSHGQWEYGVGAICIVVITGFASVTLQLLRDYLQTSSEFIPRNLYLSAAATELAILGTAALLFIVTESGILLSFFLFAPPGTLAGYYVYRKWRSQDFWIFEVRERFPTAPTSPVLDAETGVVAEEKSAGEENTSLTEAGSASNDEQLFFGGRLTRADLVTLSSMTVTLLSLFGFSLVIVITFNPNWLGWIFWSCCHATFI